MDPEEFVVDAVDPLDVKNAVDAMSGDLDNMGSSIAQTVSNILCTLTILSCLFLKVPQIVYIRERRSAEGIYVQALLMEIAGFTIVTLYNYTNQYSVMTYLEYPIILVQIFVMLFYVLKYKRLLPSPIVPLLTMCYVLLVIGFAYEFLPKEVLSYLLPLCTPLSGFAKVTYMYGIVQAANADAVSISTWIISVCTNLSRLFTVFVDSADLKLMVNFAVSASLSASVLATALYYQRNYPSAPASASAPRHTRRRGHKHD